MWPPFVVLLVLLAAAEATSRVDAALTPDQWWQAFGSQILDRFENGQCTDLAAAMRPDVVQAVDERMYSRSPGSRVNVDWRAKRWAANARWAGLSVGRRPQVGALAVFQPRMNGASRPGGHIAVVLRVLGPRIVVFEEHAPRVWWVTSRRLRPAAGVEYIYRG